MTNFKRVFSSKYSSSTWETMLNKNTALLLRYHMEFHIVKQIFKIMAERKLKLKHNMKLVINPKSKMRVLFIDILVSK